MNETESLPSPPEKSTPSRVNARGKRKENVERGEVEEGCGGGP